MLARALLCGLALAFASIASADAMEVEAPAIDLRPASPVRLAFRPDPAPAGGNVSRERLERILCSDGAASIDLYAAPRFSSLGAAALPAGHRTALVYSSPLLRVAVKLPGLCSCSPVDVERICACALPPRAPR
jgi:hypothetical protein